MRCYQHIGLTQKASDFLNQYVVRIPDVVCPKCNEIISTKMDCKVYTHEDMFYGDGPDLHEYKLTNGEIIKEVVQESPWSPGPMVFLCLELQGKKMYQWTDEEIEEISG